MFNRRQVVKDLPSGPYLQDGPDTIHTCWFLVGDPRRVKPELISGCKLHLMAYSVPMRNMLYESDIAEKGTKEDPVKILDVKPYTFRNFVKFVNFNSLPFLSFEEDVDLVYIAEKYIVEDLKMQIGYRIAYKINEETVFVLMKRPECFENQYIKEAIYKVIQQNTKELLANTEFIHLSASELLHIVNQETLSVTEPELWAALVRWATHQAQSTEGPKLREVLFGLLNYVRFCTFNMDQFCKEVVSAEILTANEVLSINMIFGERLDCKKWNTISYELSVRNVFIEETYLLDFSGIGSLYLDAQESSMFITTDDKGIQLLSGEIQAPRHNFRCAPKNLKFQFSCEVSLLRITDYEKNSSAEAPICSKYEKEVGYNSLFAVNFVEDMKLLPNNKYKLRCKFSQPFPCKFFMDRMDSVKPRQYERFTVSWSPSYVNASPATHFHWFEYKIL